ncbi:MAG: gliding motility-associated C-terminal domain-containing protein [Bacteroidetes bacterium]|nr:gliding motility-associated C-terminal domain-containing protein [Bacteroidota bacterium]
MKKLYNPFISLLFLMGILAQSTPSEAQVAASDSLTLVSLYNTTGGSTWINHSGWLSGSVATWYGITTAGGRVTRISLPGNNLSGAATDSLYRLTGLKVLNLSTNGLTYFPVLTGLHLDTLNLANNKLTFRHLVPNKAHVDSFYYAPQDSAGMYIDTIATEQSAISLVTAVDANPSVGDNYAWYLDTTLVVSGASNVYTILCMDSSDAGMYYVKITNSQLPALTLYRRPFNLRVRKLANPGPDFHVCAATSVLQGTAPAGASVLWATVAGGGLVTNDTIPAPQVVNLTVGANVFQFGVTANNVSCPAHFYSYARVVITRDTNPSPAYAGMDQSVCSPQAILTAAPPSAGTGTWTVIKGSGTVAQSTSATSAVNGLSFGENILRWQLTNGACTPAFFDEVKIYRDDTLRTVNAGMDTSICPTTYVLGGILPDDASGAWSVVSGAGSFSPADSPRAVVSGLNELANTLRWTVTNSCNTVSDDVVVTVYHFVHANAGPDRTVYYSPITRYPLGDTVSVAVGGTAPYTYAWTPAENLDDSTKEHALFLTPDTGVYSFTILVTDVHGCSATDDVTYTAGKGTSLTVPTLFTPNDDGLNDELYIPGLESYPNNELTVVDRNDQVVLHRVGYKNDWKGTNEEGFSQLGHKLAVDTYFYTLKLEEGKPLQKGYFLIKY